MSWRGAIEGENRTFTPNHTQSDMKRLLLLSCILASAFAAYAQADAIEKRLFELPDLIFKPIETPEGFEAAYELHIKQPIDHENPAKGHFYQRAYLSHRSFDAPVVLATEGYSRPSNRMYELTNYLQANQLDVEHRYFGTSVPDSLDYRFLNLKQVAGDLHRMRALLGRIYGSRGSARALAKAGRRLFSTVTFTLMMWRLLFLTSPP